MLSRPYSNNRPAAPGGLLQIGDPPFSERFAENKYAWPASFTDAIDYTVEVLMANKSAGQKKFYDLGQQILSSRPQTILHGDLNSGNLWKSKKDGGGFLLADWQLLRMGPVGMDFLTMTFFQERHTVDRGQYRQLMEHHHALLVEAHPSIAQEYPLQHLIDDIAIFCEPQQYRWILFDNADSLNGLCAQIGSLSPSVCHHRSRSSRRFN